MDEYNKLYNFGKKYMAGSMWKKYSAGVFMK